jgi:ABC-type glycerol-3-phosphate transport system substrate-binding protein
VAGSRDPAGHQASAIFPSINHAPVPRGPVTRASTFWPSSLAIFEHSKHKALAMDLVAYITDGPQLARWLEKTEGAGGSLLQGLLVVIFLQLHFLRRTEDG